MTDEGLMSTSEITDLLRHSSPAVTRDWIRRRGLEVEKRDKYTGEKKYSRADVEQAIAEMPRGPYEKARPPAEERRDDHHDGPVPD